MRIRFDWVKWCAASSAIVVGAGLALVPTGAAAPAGAAALTKAAVSSVLPARVVAAGLDQPHGVAIGPNGDLYVAEVGNGKVGAGCKTGSEAACVNDSGVIARVTLSGGVKTIVSGLPEIGNPGGAAGAAGVAGVAVIGHWIYAVIQNSGINAKTGKESFGKAGALLGDLVRAPLSGGKAKVVASFGPYEAAHNPDHGKGKGPGDPPIDSDPYGLVAYHGGIAVADAAGNDILWVSPTGKISTLAVLPLIPEPTAKGHVLSQAVPTSLAVGPDGALYVGELGGAAANDKGDVNVYRIVPGQAPKVVASHLTMIGGIAFDPSGRLVVLEIDTAGINDPSMGLPAPGAVVRFSKNFKVRTKLASKGLEYPLGLAVTKGGAIDVSNLGILPAVGGPIPGLSGQLIHLG
jgi:hypothetical protein